MLFEKDERTVFEIRTASSVINFNDGFQGVLKVFTELDVKPVEGIS